MLLSHYYESSAYDDETEEFDELADQIYINDFRDDVVEYLSSRKFPLQLVAENSNWRGQTGYATVESVDEIVDKLFSFDSNWYELHKFGNSYYFLTSTHDAPTPFRILVRSL